LQRIGTAAILAAAIAAVEGRKIMPQPGFIRAAAARPPALRVLGEEIDILASGEETGGYELFVQRGGLGMGPPLHAHDWDESFYILSGEIEVGVGEETALCGPGTLAHVPAGTVHWFRFLTDGEMLSITSRLGASLFFAEVERATGGRNDVEETVGVALRHGLTVHPPAEAAIGAAPAPAG
jgi:mannose-6-phosphate isomerase-like protein (cupin superfamily)